MIAAGSLLGTLLAKPNEKFMYVAVREGGRARDFEEAIEWLVSAGMINRVYNVSKMEHPLSAFDKLDNLSFLSLIPDVSSIWQDWITVRLTSLSSMALKSFPLKQREALKNGLITNMPLYLARKMRDLLD